MEKHVVEYKRVQNDTDYYSAWLNAEIRRYGMIMNHIKFLRKNKGYWRDVHAYLCGELTDGSLTLHVRAKPDKTGQKPSR